MHEIITNKLMINLNFFWSIYLNIKLPIITPDKIDYLEVNKPKRALDTTGAGDSFNGTYLACRLLGKIPLESARAAQAVSALVVQNKGALISQEKIKQFSSIE